MCIFQYLHTYLPTYVGACVESETSEAPGPKPNGEGAPPAVKLVPNAQAEAGTEAASKYK